MCCWFAKAWVIQDFFHLQYWFFYFLCQFAFENFFPVFRTPFQSKKTNYEETFWFNVEKLCDAMTLSHWVQPGRCCQYQGCMVMINYFVNCNLLVWSVWKCLYMLPVCQFKVSHELPSSHHDISSNHQLEQLEDEVLFGTISHSFDIRPFVMRGCQEVLGSSMHIFGVQ